MKIIIEKQVDTSYIKDLCDALIKEQFSEACCIGLIQNGEIYLRCPNTKHGVVIDTALLNKSTIEWAIESLKKSVILQNI